MRRFAALALVLLLDSACGSLAAGSGATSGATAAVEPTITSSDVALGSAMQHISQQLGITDITSIDIGPASDHLAGEKGDQVSFTFDASSGQPLIKSEWEAFVATGVLRDQAAVAGSTPIVGITLSNGTTVNLTGIDHPKITETAVSKGVVSSALDDMGLQLVSFQVAQMDSGVAVSVTARTGDVAGWGVKFGNDAVSRVFGDINGYEGTYLEVDDAQGDPEYVSAYAARAAHGSGWISDTLRPYDDTNGFGDTLPFP